MRTILRVAPARHRPVRDNPRLHRQSADDPTDPSDPDTPLSYEQAGVNYDLIDPLKVAAQRAAAATGRAPRRRTASPRSTASRGESAYVVDVGPFYLASIVECLGSKALVADEMQALTGKSYYDGIAQDTIAMAINDLITVGATPLVVQAYWAAGGSRLVRRRAARAGAGRPAGSAPATPAASPGAAARRRRWPASSRTAASTSRPRAPASSTRRSASRSATSSRPATRSCCSPRAASTPTA